MILQRFNGYIDIHGVTNSHVRCYPVGIVNYIYSTTIITLVANCHYYRLPTKLREGNVFTHVYHSVHRGGGRMMSLPVWLPGPMFLQEGVPTGGWGGGSVYSGLGTPIPVPRSSGSRQSGWSAYYWNAFLLRKGNQLFHGLNCICFGGNYYH